MTTQMAWPAVGTRVILKQDVERFPSFIAPCGATGTVTESTQTGRWTMFTVKMDTHINGCEEWDNEIVWQDVDPWNDVAVMYANVGM